MGGALCASAAPLAEGSKHRCAHRLLRVHIPAPACYACLCPHLWMATHGPQCPLFSPRLLHSEVLWTGRHSNLFVTLPAASGTWVSAMGSWTSAVESREMLGVRPRS